jgi:hypothetical protein
MDMAVLESIKKESRVLDVYGEPLPSGAGDFGPSGAR